MTIELKPEQAQMIDQAIQAGLIQSADDVVNAGLEAIREQMETRLGAGKSARQEAVRRMQEFGEKHCLDLGEPITRELLHEGHRR